MSYWCIHIILTNSCSFVHYPQVQPGSEWMCDHTQWAPLLAPPAPQRTLSGLCACVLSFCLFISFPVSFNTHLQTHSLSISLSLYLPHDEYYKVWVFFLALIISLTLSSSLISGVSLNLPNFLVPDKASNNASKSTKIVTQSMTLKFILQRQYTYTYTLVANIDIINCVSQSLQVWQYPNQHHLICNKHFRYR